MQGNFYHCHHWYSTPHLHQKQDKNYDRSCILLLFNTLMIQPFHACQNFSNAVRVRVPAQTVFGDATL